MYETAIRQRGGSYDVDLIVRSRPLQKVRSWFLNEKDARQYEAVAKEHGFEAYAVLEASRLMGGYGHFERDWQEYQDTKTGPLPVLENVRLNLESHRDDLDKLLKKIAREQEYREDEAAEAASATEAPCHS